MEKVEFYDGTTLLATCTAKPYKVVLTGAKKGKHTLKAVATDNDGETSNATVEVTLQAPTSLTISSDFNEGGALPAGWTTYDGKEKRTGYSNGYSLGCRVLQFTGSPRGLNYGLYFRNIEGKTRQGWAKYGLSDGGTTLNLAPGHYTLKYKICNWNKPEFSPVELNIEKRTGSVSIAKQTYTPTINIGNVASNNFGNLQQETFEFDITTQDNYVIALYTADVEYGDGVIGQLLLTASEFTSTGIEAVYAPTTSQLSTSKYYTLQGQEVAHPTHGIYIHNGKKVFVK